MRLGTSVHDTHVMNTVCPILSEVTDQEVTLMFRGLYRQRVVQDGCAFGTGRLCLRPFHGTTCKEEGVTAHVRGGERFSGQVCDPVTELVVTRCDKSDPLIITGVANRKVGVAAVTLMG